MKSSPLVHNRTDKDQEFTVSASAKNGQLHGEVERSIKVAARSSEPVYFDYEAGDAGFTEILMTASCGAGQDASLKRLPCIHVRRSKSSLKRVFAKDKLILEIPEGVDLQIPVSRSRSRQSIAGDMLDSLDYLVAYPHVASSRP